MEEMLSETHEKPIDIEAVLDGIEKVCQPASIFLYGSQARTDATANSDYEIGGASHRKKVCWSCCSAVCDKR